VKKRIWMVLLVVSLGINIGFLLHWFWPKNTLGHAPVKGQSPFGWHSGPMRRGLGLDVKQARLMESERRQVFTQAQPLQEQLRLKRRELFLLLKSKAITGAELDLALNEISRLQTEIEKMFILHSLKMKGFLTPAQLEKYDGFFEQGLCPGMMSGKACPPGESLPACEKKCEPKK